MAKINDEKPADIAVMSEQMLKDLKKEIAYFGFTPTQYTDFLVSVQAMGNDKRSVMSYPNSDIELYREKHIKKHEHGLNDAFVFEKYAKGKEWFYPRSFWDKVLDM